VEFIERVAPEKKSIIKLYRGKRPLFETYYVNKQVKSAFGKNVTMRSGAYLVIEHTEAMHVIDVNSGPKINRTENQDTHAFKVNKEAAQEIARQLRLRNIGGIIVIDFIDMKSHEYRNELLRVMQEAMANDKAKHSILPVSKFGLLQITRQRSSAELNIDTTEKLPEDKGRIESCLLLIETIKRDMDKFYGNGQPPRILYVHPFVEAYLKRGLKSIQAAWSWEYKNFLKVIADSSYNLMDYSICDKEGERLHYIRTKDKPDVVIETE
jgi:ribonuclease G